MLASATVGQGLFWCLAPLMSFPALAAGALASGLVLVPGSTVTRLIISSLVPEGQRHTAFALDSMATELSYMAGPPLAVLTATQVSTSVSLIGLGSALVLPAAPSCCATRQPERKASPVPQSRPGCDGTS